MSAPAVTADLSGLVVVVTGAGGDAGAPTVRHMVAAGATVIAAGRSQERLDTVVESASGGPGAAVTSVIDLLDEANTLAWGHELLETYGRVDGLLHLVGGWRGGKGIVESDLADWDFLERNVIRTLQHTTRALHDPLKASPRGRLAIVSTTGLKRPRAKNAAYVAAKAAAEAWTLAVADSFAGSGAAAAVIRVMALLTPQMREDKPDAAFKNFVAVDDLADQLVGLWDRPADELNGDVLQGLVRG